MSEAILQQILGALGTIETGMGHMAMQLNSLESRMGSLETKVDHLAERMDAIETRMGSLETKVDQLEYNVTSLDIKVDRIESKLDTTFVQVGGNTEMIHEIAATQEQHKRVLDTLSIRSIAQEAFIRSEQTRVAL